jgi:MarR family transcriptional regulator for hemolysin
MINWDITKSIGYTVLTLGRQFSRNINQHIASLSDDVTMKQGAVLYFIARSPSEDLIQQDIANVMDINKSATLRTIDILEKKGFLKRFPVPNDRRKNRIEVTKEGLKVVDAFIVTIMQKDADLKESVTDEELKSFFKVVDNLYKKLCSEQMNSSL